MVHGNTGKTPLPHPLPTREELGPLVGERIAGYELVAPLGEGPSGVVYRCTDEAGAPFAIKVMHRELQRAAAGALRTELRRMGEHAHVARGVAIGFTDDGQLFQVRELLAGRDLAAEIQAGPIAPRDAAEIVRQVCLGVEAAHRAHVVHGGIKPRNVFLVQLDGESVWDHVQVLDFGCARAAGTGERGVIVGNPTYMAPEQFGGRVDARSDVYAIGVLLHELFTGAPPFAGPSGQVMLRQLGEAAAPLAGVDSQLSDLVLRALAKDPGARFPNVRELREAVEQWASDAALVEAAAFHVVHRAAQVRAAQGAEAVAESTSPTPKMEKESQVSHTEHSGMGMSLGPSDSGGNGQNDSVEASLEDFISQANKSFQEPADGWTLNTDEVELVTEADLAPVQPAKIAAAVKGAPVIAKQGGPEGRSTMMGIGVAQGEQKIESRPPPAPGATAPQAIATNPGLGPVPQPVAPALAMPAALPSTDTPVDGLPAAMPEAAAPEAMPTPIEHADPVSAPLPVAAPMAVAPSGQLSGPTGMPTGAMAPMMSGPMMSGPVAAPATSNPLVLFGIIFGAFVLGAVVVFALLKFFMVSQVQQTPMVVNQPAQLPTTTQLAVPPALAAPTVTQIAPSPAVNPQVPVVTPLAPTGPVVTPLAPTQPPPPVAVAPEAEVKRPVRIRKPAAPREKPVAREKPAERPVVAAPREKPAEKPVKEKPAGKPAKPEKKGADWVDPF